MLKDNLNIDSDSTTKTINEPYCYRDLDDVEVKLKDKGYFGVFAIRDLPKESTLLTISTEKTLLIPDRFSVQFTEDQHLDSNYIQWLKFTNHNCNPNIKFEVTPEKVIIKASKDLKKGDELMFNYLTTEYDMHEKFICNCLSNNCYKEIGGFKNLSNEAKLELLPKLTPFLKKKYEDEFNCLS